MDELTVHYRGHLIIQRLCSGTGCDVVYGPDGSAHPTLPTIYEYGGYSMWVVARARTAGPLKELEVAWTYDEARRIVDALAGGPSRRGPLYAG